MKTPRFVALGARLRAARQAAGLTQVEAAARIGVGRPSLTMWELGHHDVTYSRLTRLMAAYGADPTALFPPATTQEEGAAGRAYGGE